MSKCLVLNVTEQPLTVVPVERALALILKEKVDVIASNGKVFHSENEEFHAPSVVRVRYFVKVPYKVDAPRVSRKAVFARDRGECQYCGGRAENLDHVVPRAKGGRHSWDNLVAACHRCNTRKGDKTLSQSGLTLRAEPHEPRGSRYYVFGRPDPSWATYLS